MALLNLKQFGLQEDLMPISDFVKCHLNASPPYRASHSWCFESTDHCPAPWTRAAHQTCWASPCCCTGTGVESHPHKTGCPQRTASEGTPARSPAAARTRNGQFEPLFVNVIVSCISCWYELQLNLSIPLLSIQSSSPVCGRCRASWTRGSLGQPPQPV